MILIEPRLRAALDAATSQIRATLTEVASTLSDTLGTVPQANHAPGERELLNAARFELRRNLASLHLAFDQELTRRVTEELAPRDEPKRARAAATNWQSLTLVDESEVEGQMVATRIGQQIWHACESELRDLASYMGSLLQHERSDQDRNPLRADVVGASIYRAVEAVSNQPETRKLLAREFGNAMAKAMPACYAEIVRGLQARGIEPVSLSVRQVEGPGNQLPGLNSGYASLSQRSDLDPLSSLGGASATSGYEQRSGRGGSSTLHSGPGSSTHGGYSRSGPASQAGSGTVLADAQLMALLRHLTAVASRPGELESALGSRYGAAAAVPAGPLGGAPTGVGNAPMMAADGMTGLMAVNLIRAHREELLQASTGKLDHMVIDVVGSLFDQILSDSRVPPQMARQIARLQLPVLRVALNDSTFFSSRRHPVRRFVNRIASLACAFDDFEDGPGKPFLARVRELVQEIVEGDFDQIELYTAKLAELEGFIADQTQEQVEQEGTVGTLGTKEAELRLQQRYMLQLQAALMPLGLPDYLQDFLPQVWSQALVLAANRDGADSDRAQRYRRVARDLVMSVQPKGSPPLRKKFLMQLPPLMKDLKEGLALIGWPEAAQREFFARLLPAHAESLKAPPLSELDHNMMVKQLENIFNVAVPASATLSPSDPVPEVDAEMLAKRFSPEEAQRVGLVTESAVDWSGTVDIDLGADFGPDSGHSVPGDSAAAPLPGLDIDIALSSADPPEPTRGPALMDHVRLGFAYQMHLKDEWQKVRLAHVSAARSFFVFTRGKKHQETISMTARMLARMCETNRFRAVESAYLIERATHRARRQLAALGTPTPTHAATRV